MLADLHIHTNYSDGVFSPQEVIKMAITAKLKAIAITDHDITDGIIFAQMAAGKEIEIIPGVEISASYNSKDVHILGYYIDINNTEFLDALAMLRNSRLIRFNLMLEKLYSLGIKLDMPVTQHTSTAMGRAHIAYAMLAAGIVQNKQEAFDRYIGLGKPAYVPRQNIDPIQAINLIIKAKGVPVLAHPVFGSTSVAFINELISAGLKGLEVYHPSHKKKHIKILNKIVTKNNLIATGGSDFHGATANNVYYNKIGSLPVDYSVVEKLKALAVVEAIREPQYSVDMHAVI